MTSPPSRVHQPAAALNTRDHEIVCEMLKILQQLVVSGDMIGEALVPSVFARVSCLLCVVGCLCGVVRAVRIIEDNTMKHLFRAYPNTPVRQMPSPVLFPACRF